MTSLSQSMESTTVSFSVVLGLKKYSQRVDCFMGAVHCGHVIWTRVVEHRVPIGQHQYSAGTDVKDAHWITHEQGDDGRHTALKQGSDVLEKSAGAGKTGAQAQPSQASGGGAQLRIQGLNVSATIWKLHSPKIRQATHASTSTCCYSQKVCPLQNSYAEIHSQCDRVGRSELWNPQKRD